jgi:hypothetical protein
MSGSLEGSTSLTPEINSHYSLNRKLSGPKTGLVKLNFIHEIN